MTTERVHPVDSSPTAATGKEKVGSAGFPTDPKLPSGTYVVHVRKDQVYRVPPPENKRLYESYSRGGTRGPKRSPCCRCIMWALCILTVLCVASAVLYFVIRPVLPTYSVTAIRPGLVESEFDIAILTDNPNKKIGIRYVEGSDITVAYSKVVLGRGEWPAFNHRPRNVTVFSTVLTGTRLNAEVSEELSERREVPLEVHAMLRVRVKVGSLESWTVKAKVECYLLVDKPTKDANVVATNCDVFSSFW